MAPAAIVSNASVEDTLQKQWLQPGVQAKVLPVAGTVFPRNEASADTHTMGSSLERYLFIKVHQEALARVYSEIIVLGRYSRYSPDSIPFDGEKRDKPFNWERPTARVDEQNNVLYIECFPGYDHIEHYAEIIAGYLRILEESGRGATPSSRVSFVPASCSDTLAALHQTNLSDFPGDGVHTVVLGLVWHLPQLTRAQPWSGQGPWQWIIDERGGPGSKVAFLGFRPAFWGDISGEVVHLLASRFQSIREIIYLGKLGVLTPGIRPNAWLATGSQSLVHGRIVQWKNTLQAAVEGCPDAKGTVMVGTHVTLGSVLHETKAWHAELVGSVDFVDPEIGMMAQAAVRCGIGYGYLHMITDNLGTKYDEDLSNERTERVLKARTQLHDVVQRIMKYHLARTLDVTNAK